MSEVSVALLSSASESAAAPEGLIRLLDRLQQERRVRDARGKTGPPAQSSVRTTYVSDVTVALLLSASESAAAPTSPMWFLPRLQRGEEGQVCSWRERPADTEQGSRDLLERCQRSVALERLRECRGVSVADLVAIKAAARRGESEMLMARQGRRHSAGRARLTRATSASRCS
jgi:hypothetical protein